MPTSNRSPRRHRGGCLVLLLTVAVIVGIGTAIWRSTSSSGVRGCTATVGEQVTYLEPDQAENATLIAAIGVRRGLPARAVSIALATAYQESKIRNLSHGDRDSLGIFQQRPSQGWGTEKQVRDPYYAINAFYDALVKVEGYQTMRITEAAQRVQRSGYPEAYEKHAADARAVASALTGYSLGGAFTCTTGESSSAGKASEVITQVERAYGDIGIARTGVRQDVAVTVSQDESGRRLGWSVAAYLLAHAEQFAITSVTYDGLTWSSGTASSNGWRTTQSGDAGTVSVSLG